MFSLYRARNERQPWAPLYEARSKHTALQMPFGLVTGDSAHLFRVCVVRDTVRFHIARIQPNVRHLRLCIYVCHRSVNAQSIVNMRSSDFGYLQTIHEAGSCCNLSL